jgi:hypothetical protein
MPSFTTATAAPSPSRCPLICLSSKLSVAHDRRVLFYKGGWIRTRGFRPYRVPKMPFFPFFFYAVGELRAGVVVGPVLAPRWLRSRWPVRCVWVPGGLYRRSVPKLRDRLRHEQFGVHQVHQPGMGITLHVDKGKLQV